MTYRRQTALEQLRESRTLPPVRTEPQPIRVNFIPEPHHSQPADIADYLRHCNAPYAADAAHSANVFKAE